MNPLESPSKAKLTLEVECINLLITRIMSEEEEAGVKYALYRVTLKIEQAEVRLLEDEFIGEEKGLIYKVEDPQLLKGYKFKYVMKSKLGKIVMRPQDDPTIFEHYIVYGDPAERDAYLDILADSVDDKIKKLMDRIQKSVEAISTFKQTKAPTVSADDSARNKPRVLIRKTSAGKDKDEA